ncbi:MAG: DUF5011 domain-containing protein [Candidatus Nitrosoabyssus spongiisocia]|nr:MAG: DUF5011 domain-containing protein [Nitrosopumilaceae archaeon AB1(1)]
MLILGTSYVELVATTDDNSPVISNSQEFTNAVGSYTIYYSATDSYGNTAIPVSRTVYVIDTNLS